VPDKFLRHACALLCLISLGLALSATAQQVRQGIYRGMPVTYVVKDGRAIFQGDIVLEKVDAIDPQRPLPSYGVDYSQYLWLKAGNQYQIPYVIAAGSGDLTNLNSAITQFNNTFSNIQFVARGTQTDYVSFYFDPNNNSGECEAIVGRAGGEQQVGGAGGSFNPCALGTILHEMGHTVGLWHEQSRPDRNTYVSVNYGNLIKGSISNFNQIYDNGQTFGTLFDYASIMEYPAFSFSRNGGPAIESIPAGIPLSNFTGYTATDIDGIERLYGNAPTAVTVTSNPPGLGVIVDGNPVTTPQAFTNWALFSAHTLSVASGVQNQAGNIVNSTTPTTFYYTYGRWSDSAAASHSITVLPGNGEPSTPGSSPAVTTYTANFIQLVPYAATVYPTGTGSVTPSPEPQSYSGSSLLFYTARQQVTLTATPNAGQNFYEFNNANFWLPGGLGANPKTFYVPDTGLTINTTAEFSPDPVYTVNVAPNAFSSNLYIYADTFFSYAPKNFSAFYDGSTWAAGGTHNLSVDNPIYPYSSNTRYAFNNWSDGTTTTTDAITLPATSTTYTANLTPQYFVTDYVNESCAGSINVSPGSPTGDGFYPSGDGLTFTETPNASWLFTGWQYDLSGTSASQPLTVNDEVLVTADYNTVATPLTLTALSPAAAVPGGPSFTLTLNGTGFSPSSVVSVNGMFPAVKFISSTQISVTVTAAQITKPGAFQVWVDSFPSGAICAAFAALPFTVADSPIVSPLPLSLAFAPQVVGTSATAKVVTLKNTSSAAVSISSITASGNFAVAGNTCGSSLNSHASCIVQVTCNPAIAGATTGSLAISDSAPDSPQTVTLSGTGNLPLTISPAAVAFGTETVGHTTAAKTATLTNNESSTLSFSFSASGNYAISSSGTTCGGSVASKGKCNIAVTFTPTANGSINGSVTITDAAGFSPQLIALSGSGSGGGTAPLTFTPATLAFAAQVAGTASPAKSLTVKNTSAGSVTLNSIATSGDFSAVGSGGTPCAASLNLVAGASCTLGVTFSPALGANGAISGGVVITDNAAVNQQILDAKGTAALPLAFAPTALSFAPQTVATTSTAQTVTLTNNLSTVLDPAMIGSGDYTAVPGGATPCGSTLAGKAHCTFIVTFTPSAVGTRAATITVTDSANPPVQTMSVTGTGQ
jgi:Astacin (Peptidase family M12A)/Abnormal spindle-like microcephaly-assoc'd, ASPM-SPD-2-Hydin/Divergent InlB B-repeat domain